MMRHRLLVLAALLLVPFAAPVLRAQTPQDRDGVRRAVLDYVEGFYEGDTAKIVRGIRLEVYKYGFDWLDKEKKYAGERMTWDEIIGYAKRFKARGRPTPATAPKVVELLDVQDQTASAKLTAWWGTDYVLLAKFDGQWMITSVLWQSKPQPPPSR